MAEAVVTAVVSEVNSQVTSQVAESLIDFVKREISYVFKYKSYVNDLESQLKELEYLRQRVEQDVEHAERQGEEIFQDVKDWLTGVEHFTGSIVKPIIEDEDDGLCPNLLKRHSLSKKAVKAAVEGATLLRKGNFNPVSFCPAPERPVLGLGRGYQDFDSRMSIFQEIVEVLRDSNVYTIGVYGSGGVGKTTLVEQVARQVIEDKLFDEVVVAEVTQNPDLKTIQNKIASDLGLEFKQQENMFQKAKQLRQRLGKVKRVLIILDNIWKKLILDDVGIPSGSNETVRKDDKTRCTVLLTSRSRDLLCSDMNSQKNFLIEVLSKAEAGQLFEKIVGGSEKTSDFQPIADEIVERCGGLPVALNTIANALKNKSLPIWEDALVQLRNSNPREIHGMHKDVYSSIELSYNFLESEEAKSLFRLCGLQNDGSRIHVDDLMKYGAGLGLFSNVHALKATRNRMHSLIDNLKSSSLLLDNDNEDYVKMHDIIHAVAVSIARKELMFNIQNVTDLKEEIEDIIQKDPMGISIPNGAIHELPERIKCPKIKLFVLLNKHSSSLQIPNLFFEGMEELRVLHFSRTCFFSLPSSELGCLINLQTLCLEDCQLEDIAIVGQLKKLEILSFRYSDIKQLPVAIGELTCLQLLDLSNCWNLEVIASNVISRLSRLEELYMGNSFSQWEKVGGGSNASLVELKGLSKLSTLDIHIKDAQIMPHDLVLKELERHRICIGDVWGRLQPYEYEISRLMKLGGLGKSILLSYGMNMLLKRTEVLCLKELKGFHNVVHELGNEEAFSQLKHFCIENSYEILHIVSSVGQVHYKVFPLLESLFLYNLINLEKICQGQLKENQSFRNLMIIRIYCCNRLKHLFSFSMAKNLLRLQKIKVTDCNNLEMIVGPNMEKPTTTLGSEEIIAEDDPGEKVNFPSLEKLGFELITIEKLWPDLYQGMSCCQNLTKVTVDRCDRLKYLFSYSMVNSLVQLQHLKISYCASMEGVVDTTGLGRDEGKLIEMVFPKLHYLELSHLSELTSFAMCIYSVEFPSLLQLHIRFCDNLRRFITLSSSEDNIPAEMQPQPLFDEKVVLPSLESLSINFSTGLRKIWHHQNAADSFSKLKELNIRNCYKLKNIFPYNITLGRRLERLEYLRVEDCDSMEDIIEETSSNCKVSMAEVPIFVFPHLTSLRLWGLPKLKSFYPRRHISEWPVLKQLVVHEFENVEILFASPEFISLESQLPLFLLDHKVALPSLMTLDVSSCNELRRLMTLSVAESMMELTKMKINDCRKIEEIIQQVGEVKESVVFNQLECLEFCNMPSLQSFCSRNYTLEFPSLRRVFIKNCPSMKIFSQGVVGTPKLNKVHLPKKYYDGGDDEESWEWKGNLNSTVQHLFEETNEQSSSEE